MDTLASKEGTRGLPMQPYEQLNARIADRLQLRNRHLPQPLHLMNQLHPLLESDRPVL